jgi:hypothetical protein
VTPQVLTTDSDLLRAAAWCRDRAEFADCSGTCGRTLATCRQHGDLPIYLRETEGPFCKPCWEATHMPKTDAATFDLDEVIDGEPIWKTAHDLYEAGNTWPQVAYILTARTTQQVPHWRTICSGVQKRTEAAHAPAPPAEEEAPAPAPEAPPAPAQAQATASCTGYISITRNGVSINVSGESFDEVREVAIRLLDGLAA